MSLKRDLVDVLDELVGAICALRESSEANAIGQALLMDLYRLEQDAMDVADKVELQMGLSPKR